MDESTGWIREQREVPADLLEAAAESPGGSIAEIDGDQVSDPDGYVPPEAIIGAYIIGDDGVPTGEYVRNPNHGPVRDDLTPLESPDVWLGWLGDTPAQTLRYEIGKVLEDQVEGSVLEWFKVIEEPVHFAGGRQSEDPDKMILVRAAISVPFALGVRPPGQDVAILTGAFTWASSALDTAERKDRIWLDFGIGREDAESLIQQRVLELDEPIES